ncbi:BamA/TamA family outer membrane protein [Costertonia aggregata]|uniref:BamA/TamA family outer membrane protein n=2 Tax=Costertonia aggregata TaxID=343403 RepID=A0A7H9AUM5_9FLAO|nr:BamA/TamA family outer membrane protein [Costertonia aggregata]
MTRRLIFIAGTAKIRVFLLCIILCSCNALKRVDADEALLVKNTIYADGKKVTDTDIQSLISQKPNSNLLGFPLRLHLYNLAKPNPDSSYQAWLHKKEKREQRLINWLSKKQVDSLGESFLVKGYSEWLKKIGEAPVIIDTSKTCKSLQRMSAYYGNRGYFNNTTTFTIDSTKREQRAEISYKIDLGNAYMIDTLTKKTASKAIDSLYALNFKNSLIKEGEQFDLSNFNKERERLTSIFRNTGVYNFQESSITFNILRDTSTTRGDRGMDVELNIDNLKKRGDSTLTTTEYEVFTFNKINIYADYRFDDDPNDLQSVDYNNYTIYFKDKLRYKPKALTDAIFIEKDSIYRELNKIRTYRQISNLNTFRYPTIELEEDSTQNKLKTNIYLSARPKYSLETNLDVTHSNIQRLGIAFSSALITRNVFGGAETLNISARGSFGLLSDQDLPEDFFSEIGGDINLTFPRIWLPFNTKKIIPYYMLPQTRMTVGTSFQKNIGLDKQTLNAVLGYNWTPSSTKRNELELLNVQFVRNVNPENFFNVYQNSYRLLDGVADRFDDPTEFPELAELFETPEGTTEPRLIIPSGTSGFTNSILDNTVTSNIDDRRLVNTIEERRQRLTEDNLIFTTNYSFSKNNKTSINDLSFYQFRFKVEGAGNLLSLVSNIIPFEENNDGNGLVFGVAYSQYVKTEFDFIKHWQLSPTNVLAMRSFAGIAIPYGNSNNIPFVRSYFAGGSNDNRAWNPYSLGPGSTQNLNDFNEANLKLAFNLEYRFPIIGNIKGALFADAGNIWNVFDDVEDPEATFNGFSSLKDIALGTGMGIRYDFTYFVFRLDVGFKTYNPALETSKRWFSDYNLGNAVYNIGINYPF